MKNIFIIIFYTSVFERFKKLILIGFQKEECVMDSFIKYNIRRYVECIYIYTIDY